MCDVSLLALYYVTNAEGERWIALSTGEAQAVVDVCREYRLPRSGLTAELVGGGIVKLGKIPTPIAPHAPSLYSWQCTNVSCKQHMRVVRSEPGGSGDLLCDDCDQHMARISGPTCKECGQTGTHKMQCSEREQGLRLPARARGR